MRFFRYPAEKTSVPMSRSAWAVNRTGICMMAIGIVLALVAMGDNWNGPLALAAAGIGLPGAVAWFFAGSPVS
jgi:hypothetical protein